MVVSALTGGCRRDRSRVSLVIYQEPDQLDYNRKQNQFTTITITITITMASFCLTSGLPSISNHLQPSNFHQNPTILPLGTRTTGLKKWVFLGQSQRQQASPLKKLPQVKATPGLYSSETFELTVKNVDLVLEDVRPYLISDGGNVDVVSVEDGIVSLKLQGACDGCPSSTTTMTMGIERVLKEKFGEAIKDIRQVSDEQQNEVTVEAVNRHLDILRPAIKNYGGSVEVISIDGGDCHVKYEGPDSIGSGIKAAIKEKFPDIVNVVLSS